MNNKLLCVCMKYDYGNKARGISFEWRNFYHPLKSYCKKRGWEFLYYDFMERGQQIGLDSMTQELYELAQKEHPTLLFALLMDFHRDPRHDVFRRISELGTTTIHWFCDDHWRFENYSSIIAPNFDFVCTTSNSAIPKYRNLGIEDRLIKTQWACNHELYVPYAVQKDIDISFVGQPHGNRIETINYCLQNGLDVQIYGYGWANRPRLPFHQMVRLFSRTKVNLNLSNSSTLIGQQIKGRNFEIPGTKSFLLTSNAENLKEYYLDGKEIVIFNSPEELVNKAKYFITHDREREEIAQNGYRRTLAEHTWHHRYDQIFDHINKNLTGKHSDRKIKADSRTEHLLPAAELADANASSWPVDVVGFVRQADEFFLKGDFSGALKNIRQTLEKFPGEVRLVIAYGNILLQMGKKEAACIEFIKAMILNREYVSATLGIDALMVLADSYKQNGYKDKAISLYRRVLEIDDKNSFAQAKLRELGELPVAVQPLTEQHPFVSVIIPCYNQAHFLPEVVESIVNQTYKNWECIIVNDGSPDNTTEVAKQLIDKYPEYMIRLVEKQNGGLSDARNAGIREAKGIWILPLDSDDMFSPDFLERAVSIVHNNPDVNLVTTNLQAFGTRPHVWIPADYSTDRILYEDTFIYASLYKKELWEAVGGYYSGIPWGAEDWNFWIACSRKGIKPVRIPEKLFLYRTHPGTSMMDRMRKHWDQVNAMIQTLHTDLYSKELLLFDHDIISVMHPDTVAKLNSIISKFPNLYMPYFWRGLHYDHAGKFDLAIKDYLKSVELSHQKDWQPMERLKLLEEKLLTTRHLPEKVATYNEESHTLQIAFCLIFNKILPQGINAGLERATLELAKALAARGHQITVIAPPPTPDIFWEGVHFVPLTDEVRNNFNEMFPEIDVFCAASHANTFSRFKLPSSVVKAVHFHHCSLDGTIGSAEEKERILKIEADILLSVSEFSRLMLIRFGVDQHKIFTLHNGINQDIFYPDPSIRRSPHTLLYAGAIDPAKRPEYAIQTAKLLREHFPDLALRIAGSAEMWGGTHSYIDFGELTGQYPFIQYLGALSQDKLREEYCKAAVLLIPSHVESFGMSSLEAQRCGCIPVASAVGGLPETMLPGETGVLVDNLTPEGFAEAVIELLRDEGRLEIMREKASGFALRFDWKNIAAQAEKLFVDTVKQKQAFKPRVSVIIPCYNYGHFLERAVRSVLTQTYKDFEIIIVNDGSTDNTLQVAEGLIAANPLSRIKLISQSNSGKPAIARNNGIAQATGDYILCLDADDMIDPNFLKESVDVLDKYPDVSITIPFMQLFGDQSGYKPPEEYNFERLKHVNTMITACVFRKKAWDDAGGYNPDISGYEDWDFWISCGEHHHYARPVPKAIFFYRSSNEGTGARHVTEDQQIKAQIILKHAGIYTPAQIQWAQGIMKKDPDILALPHREGVIPFFKEQSHSYSTMGPIQKHAGLSIEQQLENLYSNLLQSVLGMSLSDSAKTVKDMLKQAHEESVREGTANLPQNLGDKLLEKEKTLEAIRTMLSGKRNEGVRDEDIRWWWNMDEIERRMALKFDDMLRDSQYQRLIKQAGLKETEAVRIIKKNYPVFGISESNLQSDDDRPLPYELMERVNIYIERISQKEPGKLQTAIDGSSTLNAFIRKEIRKGNV